MKTRLILGCVLVFASFGVFAGAATFSGATNDGINLSVTDTDAAATDVIVLSSTLKVPGSKKDLLIAEVGDEAVNVMRLVKKSLDPSNIFNPGKVFDLERRNRH